MIKWIPLLCLIFLIENAVAQRTSADSLQDLSLSLLQRKINFIVPEGKLEFALSKLSGEQNIKFSYSHEKIQHLSVKKAQYASVPLADLLYNLLQQTGYTYLVVGSVIVIVEDERAPEPVQTPVDKTPTDTSLSPMRQPLPASAGANMQAERTHVYSEDMNLTKLPARERKKIRKLYAKEMQWASRHKKFAVLRFGTKKEDTASKSESLPAPAPKRESSSWVEQQYYVSGSLGIAGNISSMKDNTSLPWVQDLNFKYSVPQTAFSPVIRTGLIMKHLMTGAGIGFQHFRVDGSGMEIKKKGASGKADTAKTNFSDRYMLTSVPVQVLYYRHWKQFFAAAGPVLTFNFISSKVKPGKFKAYYDEKVKDSPYTEKNYKLMPQLGLALQLGYLINSYLAAGAGVSYNYSLKPISTNSLYRFYVHTLRVDFSVYYFFSKRNLSSIWGKRKK